MKKVLVAGEINVDMVLRGCSRFPAPGKEILAEEADVVLGSASAICAMGLARLGTPVAFIGKVGADAFGAICLDAMSRAGVDVSRVIVDPRLKTGITVAISSPEDRALVSFVGAGAELSEADIDDDAFAGIAHLHVSSYYLQTRLRPQCRDLFARAHRAGLTTSLDPGYDPSELWEEDIVNTLSEVDLFFPNEIELCKIARHDDRIAALRALENTNAKIVAKLGRDGAISLHRDSIVQIPALPVDPIDTTGAGDSFNAGFLDAWLSGSALAECMQFASICASLSTLGVGGTATQPTRQEARAAQMQMVKESA